MKLTLRDLYENGILRDDDDYVINIDNKRVVDSRTNIDPRYKDFLDYNVARLYARETSNTSYLVIRIEKDGEEE